MRSLLIERFYFQTTSFHIKFCLLTMCACARVKPNYWWVLIDKGIFRFVIIFFLLKRSVVYGCCTTAQKKKRIQKKKIENRQNNNRKKIVLSWHHLFQMRHKVQSIQRYGILNTFSSSSSRLILSKLDAKRRHTYTHARAYVNWYSNTSHTMPLIYMAQFFFCLFDVICKIYLCSSWQFL